MLVIQPYLDLIVSLWPALYHSGKRYLIQVPEEQYAIIVKAINEYKSTAGCIAQEQEFSDDAPQLTVITPIGLELKFTPTTRLAVIIEPYQTGGNMNLTKLYIKQDESAGNTK